MPKRPTSETPLVEFTGAQLYATIRNAILSAALFIGLALSVLAVAVRVIAM